MNNNPDKVIEEIKNGNDKVLTKIYKKVFRHLDYYCRSTGKSSAEAQEAVQDAFETFYRQVLSNKLKLTCTVDTYIVSIAKRLLAANNREQLKINYDDQVETESIIDDGEQAEMKLKEQKHQLFLSEFDNLGKDCKKILKLTLKGRSVREITERMKYSSENYTKTKRARCRKYLIDKIKTNPWYEKLTESTPENFELFIWGDDQNSETSI